MKNNTIEKMIHIFLEMEPEQYTCMADLYMKAIKALDNPELDDMCFYYEFHKEIKKLKICIKHSNKFNGDRVGLPQNVDVFCRLSTKK